MAPVMALLCVLAVRLATRQPIAWKPALLVALAGVASHLALDYTNVYGIRLLLPFSARWLRLDITSVVDPWIWAALLLSLIAPAIARLVGSEIDSAGGNKKSGLAQRPGRAAAILALAFLNIYGGARGVFHQRALAMLDSRMYFDSPPRRVAAFPDTFNPLRWRGLVEGDRFYEMFDLDVRHDFDPTHGVVFRQAEEGVTLRAAANTMQFQDFLRFSQYPLWTVIPVSDPPGGVRVQLSDMRFGATPQKGFAVIGVFDAELRLNNVSVLFLARNTKIAY
jgi:inner membrane protein